MQVQATEYVAPPTPPAAADEYHSSSFLAATPQQQQHHQPSANEVARLKREIEFKTLKVQELGKRISTNNQNYLANNNCFLGVEQIKRPEYASPRNECVDKKANNDRGQSQQRVQNRNHHSLAGKRFKGDSKSCRHTDNPGD